VTLVIEAEVREQQSDLVTVPGDLGVVEQHYGKAWSMWETPVRDSVMSVD
jgi:hypothetical protein